MGRNEIMRSTKLAVVLGLALGWALPSSAEVTKGVLAVKGAQMS